MSLTVVLWASDRINWTHDGLHALCGGSSRNICKAIEYISEFEKRQPPAGYIWLFKLANTVWNTFSLTICIYTSIRQVLLLLCRKTVILFHNSDDFTDIRWQLHDIQYNYCKCLVLWTLRAMQDNTTSKHQKKTLARQRYKHMTPLYPIPARQAGTVKLGARARATGQHSVSVARLASVWTKAPCGQPIFVRLAESDSCYTLASSHPFSIQPSSMAQSR